MITVKDVEEMLKAHASDSNGWDSCWDTWTYPRNEDVDVPGLGRVEVIGTHELSEGDWGGAEWIIFRVTLDESGAIRHFRKEGHYRSYDGSDWDYDGFYEVTPKMIEVPAYERIVYE